ncbi:MAG: substrate-binding domain-containing protein [Pseudomonadota bacterium]|nr:substrate-binding domain-containing protein [Pseudomonadota bacterium]
MFLSSAALVASAAEIRILSAGAVEPGLHAFAQVIKRERGDDLKIQFNTTPQIVQRLAAGEAFDIVIAPSDAIAQAAKDSKVAADTRVMVGRVGAGVVVRSGAPMPDIASVDALKHSLLAADSVVYNTASSGSYLDKLFDKMGILEQLKPKTTRYPTGAGVLEHVSKAYESKGVRMVGPLPGEVQNYTGYEAAMMTGTASPEEVKAILRQIATTAGRAALASGGVE